MRLLWIFESPRARTPHMADPAGTGPSRLSVWFLVATLAVFFGWSYWAEIDQLTRAPGTVIASSKTKTVQSFEPGVIQSILVSEGDPVSAGQPVLVL